jgi:hypothetical protein
VTGRLVMFKHAYGLLSPSAASSQTVYFCISRMMYRNSRQTRRKPLPVKMEEEGQLGRRTMLVACVLVVRVADGIDAVDVGALARTGPHI